MRHQQHQSMMSFDCVLLVDDRLSPAAERRLYTLIDVHAENEISTAVIVLNRGWSASSWFRSAQAQRRIREGRIAWLDPTLPCRTDLALILCPSLAAFRRNRPLRLQAAEALIWPIEADLGAGDDDHDVLRDRFERIRTILDTSVSWVARSDVERRFLVQQLTGFDVLTAIWWPLMASTRSTEVAPPSRSGIVGRHFSKGFTFDEAGSNEWQEAHREPWPMPLALLGQSDLLRNLPGIAAGQDMRLQSWDRQALPTFLEDLELYIATGEPQGPARLHEEILEALAAGLPVIASPAIGARFEDTLPSTEACFLGDLASRLLGDSTAMDTARRQQAELFERRHGVRSYLARLRDHLKGAKSDAPLIWGGAARRPGRVLFVSDDSRYLEHLPRQLAIARQLQAPLEPHFLSLSRDASLAERFDYAVEYLMPHSSKTYRELFEDAEVWNGSFARHLHELIRFIDAKAVVFDGIFPFAGLADVCSRLPGLPFAWIRRGLWQSDAEEGGLTRSGLFDLVIEPRDLGEAFDRGPTRKHRERVLSTAPILLGRQSGADRARFELGLEDGETAIFLRPTIQADRRNDQAMQELLRVLADGGCRFWSSELAPGLGSASWPVDTVELDGLEARRLLAAFDAVISSADYQSTHECAAAGTPTIFVSDPDKPTDDQPTRAAAAAREGWGLVLAQGDVYRARAAAKRLLDPEARRMMAELCKPSEANGAEQAAIAIGEMIYALDMTMPSEWRNARGELA